VIRRRVTSIGRPLASIRSVLVVASPENVAAGGLMAYGASVPDLFRRASDYVHRILPPLIKLVEDCGVLVIGVTHLNKSAGKAIYRVLDSIAFVALGRILHLVVQDSENPDNRKFLCDKTNIGPKPAGLTFICEQVEVQTSRGNIWMSRVSWGTQTINQTADEAIAAATPGANDKINAIDEAVDFLKRLLADGPVASSEVFEAAKANGIAAATLRRAKEKRGVIARHDESFEGGWKWCLPSQDDQNSPR
jgi:hypothetical protein